MMIATKQAELLEKRWEEFKCDNRRATTSEIVIMMHFVEFLFSPQHSSRSYMHGICAMYDVRLQIHFPFPTAIWYAFALMSVRTNV